MLEKNKKKVCVQEERKVLLGESPGVEDGFNVCAGAVLARKGAFL